MQRGPKIGPTWWRGFTTIERLRASSPTNPPVGALPYAAAWAVALLNSAVAAGNAPRNSTRPSLAGLDLVAHLYREPDVGHEHPSRRSYLLLRKTTR